MEGDPLEGLADLLLRAAAATPSAAGSALHGRGLGGMLPPPPLRPIGRRPELLHLVREAGNQGHGAAIYISLKNRLSY